MQGTDVSQLSLTVKMYNLIPDSGTHGKHYPVRDKKEMPHAGILSLEAREHGSVITSPSGEEILDFSIETLVKDTLAMIELVKQRQGWHKLPPAVFVGHSLGGAIVTRIAADGVLGAQLVGFAVLDVVEGSAIEALMHMKTYLASRPASFASVDQAINWQS